MLKNNLLLLRLVFSVSMLLSGCATQLDTSLVTNPPMQTSAQRAMLLLEHEKWQLRGKIAFIQQAKNAQGSDKRESATISWQVNEAQQTQALNLTSYLGINVLNLTSQQSQHVIKVNGKEYHTRNLPKLIQALTGLTLPTKALAFWLKGLAYNVDDKVEMDTSTQLPISISSNYHNALWQINYRNYRNFDGINMATKFIIKKEGLLIKIDIKQWSFSN